MIEINSPAPDIELMTDGDFFSLNSQRGKNVVIFFVKIYNKTRVNYGLFPPVKLIFKSKFGSIKKSSIRNFRVKIKNLPSIRSISKFYVAIRVI